MFSKTAKIFETDINFIKELDPNTKKFENSVNLLINDFKKIKSDLIFEKLSSNNLILENKNIINGLINLNSFFNKFFSENQLNLDKIKKIELKIQNFSQKIKKLSNYFEKNKKNTKKRGRNKIENDDLKNQIITIPKKIKNNGGFFNNNVNLQKY
jgi:hypothetical protein